MNALLLLIAFFAEVAGIGALKLSQGFSKLVPSLAMVICYGLSLTLLSFALLQGSASFEVDATYTIWAGVGIACSAIMERFWKQHGKFGNQDIGPVGATARIMLGFALAGSVVHAQLTTRFAPIPWTLGLIGFPALVLAWHWWRIRRSKVRFDYTSPLSMALIVGLFLACYMTWWYAPLFSFTSDAAIVFVGCSMILAALLGYAGCEFLAFSNWLLRRRDQIACAIFTPIDSLEHRSLHSQIERS